LEDGLEGLLHISELADHKVENPEEVVKVGEEIEVKILRVDTDERKIGLSRKRVEWAVQTPLETYLREINETALLTADEEQELATRTSAKGTCGTRPHGASQPAAGRQHRPRLHRQGLEPAGSDRRRQPGPAAGRGGLRPGHGDPLQHLRQLLDQAVHQAGPDQFGQDDPHSGLHGRAAEQVAAGQRTLTEELGRTPTPEEIARVLGLPKKKLPIIKKAIRIYNSTPQTDQAEAGWSLGEMIMDERMKSPEDELLEHDVLKHVMEMLETWTRAKPPCCGCVSDLNDTEPHTLKEIGEQLGLTRENACGRSKPKPWASWPTGSVIPASGRCRAGL
jgi:RNA polymerase primary sigma factor